MEFIIILNVNGREWEREREYATAKNAYTIDDEPRPWYCIILY